MTEHMLSDNGSEFRRGFTETLATLNTQLTRIRAGQAPAPLETRDPWAVVSHESEKMTSETQMHPMMRLCFRCAECCEADAGAGELLRALGRRRHGRLLRRSG